MVLAYCIIYSLGSWLGDKCLWKTQDSGMQLLMLICNQSIVLGRSPSCSYRRDAASIILNYYSEGRMVRAQVWVVVAKRWSLQLNQGFHFTAYNKARPNATRPDYVAWWPWVDWPLRSTGASSPTLAARLILDSISRFLSSILFAPFLYKSSQTADSGSILLLSYGQVVLAFVRRSHWSLNLTILLLSRNVDRNT